MKIALACAPVIDKEIHKNTKTMIQTMETCSGKANFVVFGESALQGFNCLTWDYETDCRMAVALSDQPILELCQAAKHFEIGVCFGYIEKAGDSLYSSQLFINKAGEIVHNFHRVSEGWKEYWHTDEHYKEGNDFSVFEYQGKKIAIALCGDLWTEGRPEEMKKLQADMVLWPVWCDYKMDEWNQTTKIEYGEQAALCGEQVLLVNPFCATPDAKDCASGGAVFYKKGAIAQELPAGKRGILYVEIGDEPMDKERLQRQLNFALEIDKEKNIFRQTHLTNHGRNENDAEHAWHMAVMAYLLKEYSNQKIDISRVMIMCLIHDIVEIDAGDTYAYDAAGLETQKAREDAAKERIFSMLPMEQKEEMIQIFDEFEENQTPESKFAHAMDNLQPLILNHSNGGADWKVHGVSAKQVYGRQGKTKEGSLALFEITDQIIQENIRKGNIKED